MKVTGDQVYKILADSIVDSANHDWKSAELKLMVVEKTVEYNLNFFDQQGQKKSSKFKRPSDLSELLIDFKQNSIEDGVKVWNRAIFKLNSEGKFNMEFVWDQALHDEIEKYNKSI